MSGLILAIQFLTRLPLNIMIDWNSENLRKSTLFFPLVGLIIGLISYGVYYIMSFINSDVAAVFTVFTLIVITGGLHLDGLSDTCDGFFSNKSREDIMEIMKDSRVGAFGVIALIVIILLKYVLINNMDQNIFIFLVFSIGNSRAVQVFNLAFRRQARKDGIGKMFSESKPKKTAVLGILIYIVFAGIININILIPFIVTFLFMDLFARYSYKVIGGVSGDVLGAMAELGEIVSMITFLGVSRWILF